MRADVAFRLRHSGHGDFIQPWIGAALAGLPGRAICVGERTAEAARAERCAGIPARRYGTAAEFGAACAFLCSARSGFMTGQNLQLDGGAYAGLV